MLLDTMQPVERSVVGSNRGAEMSWPDRPGTGEQGAIRTILPGDIPQLCEIFAQSFRAGRGVSRSELADAFTQLYLTSPLDRVRPASLVDVDASGRIGGFMGIVSLSARIGERSLRAGVLGNFMAAAHEDRARAAIRLSRATVAQDLDLIVTDTANRTSLGISRGFRFEYQPAHSLEWIKVLRPAGTAQFLLDKRWPTIGPVLRPLTRLADLAGRRLPLTDLPDFDTKRFCDRAIEPAAFLTRASALMLRFAVRPAWDEPEFAWLLDQARRKTRNGPLHLREVADHNGRTAGLYLLYAQPGAVAWALQILSRRGQDHLILSALIRHAAEIGAVAVRGNTSPAIIEGLSLHAGILFRQVAACVAFSRDPEIRTAIRTGDVMLGGLLGETWTRFVAAEFTPVQSSGPRLSEAGRTREAGATVSGDARPEAGGTAPAEGDGPPRHPWLNHGVQRR